MSNELHPSQDVLFGEKLMSDNKDTLRVGMGAIEVVSKIYSFHGVSQFSYTKYDPESSYPIAGRDQVSFWRKWSGARCLEALSKQVVESSVERFRFEGSKINIHDILAVGSKVQVEDGIKNLPMLDFDFSEGEIDMGTIKELGLTHGVILRTDHSYHYYGLNLIDDNRWRKWINKLLAVEDSELIFGTKYLELCLDRGYSALRVFGYEGTSKAMTPVVVARI